MAGRDYWERRALKLERLTRDKADDTMRVIARAYDQAQRDITARMEKIFTRYVKNNEALNEEKALRLLSARDTAEAREALLELYRSTTDPQMRAEIRARLDAPAYAGRISGLQALRDQVYLDARLLGLAEVALVQSRLLDVLEQSYYRQTFDIQQGAGLFYDFNRLSNRQMQAIAAQQWKGSNYSARIWKNNEQFAQAVERTVATGILSGQSFRDMSDSLRHVIGEDDSEGAKYKSMRLIRTECDHIAVQGQLMGYRAGGIEQYIFLATLDLATSEICRSLDMKRFPVAEAQTGVNLPPMHPNCRSVTMPDVDSETLSKIKRAARDPVTGKTTTVPGNMSYREWYGKYVEGNAEAEANEKKIRNKSADQKQFEQYRAVLGDYAPKSLVSFQRLKYNEPEKWAALRVAYRDGKVQQSIRAGEFDLTINPEKQARHMAGSSEYVEGRSVVTIPIEELQGLVQQYAGTGEIQRSKSGEWTRKELVCFDRELGVSISPDGEETRTERGIIHYSGTGVHVVPTVRKFREEV